METQLSYNLSKDQKMTRGNPTDLWAWRKNLRYDVLARYRGITKLTIEEEGGSMPQCRDPSSIPGKGYAGLRALRKNHRYDLLASHRGITEVNIEEEGKLVVITKLLNQFSKIAISNIRRRSPATIPSKDSSGLWALRKKHRYELLARFRKVHKLVMEEAMNCTENTPVINRKLVSWHSQENQGWTPHWCPPGFWKREEPHWFKKYNYMTRDGSKTDATKQQGTKNSYYGSNCVNRTQKRFNDGHQRNGGSNNGKCFPQVQNQRMSPGYNRLSAVLHTKYGMSKFRRETANFYRHNQGNAFTNGHRNSCNHCKRPQWNQRSGPQQEQRGHFHSWNQTGCRENVAQSRRQGWTNRNRCNSFHGPQTFGGQRTNRNGQNFRSFEVSRNLSAWSSNFNNKNGINRFSGFQRFRNHKANQKNQNCGC
ncbi:hypothetical protein ILYODFUR_019390 [Ilyodon furcidens]|uniref:Uncharacterized protein n=1 Tax=Ilyodon furcidens TaxID=33524 RepID=A0ABV0UW51_9TELE